MAPRVLLLCYKVIFGYIVLFVVVKQRKIDCLQADILKSGVMSEFDVLQDIVVHQSIDSTNSWCMQQSKLGRALPFACFAEEQTSGKGRRGKRWFMSAHNNVAMSLVWPFVLSEQSLHLLPLSIALAIVTTLEGMGIKHVQVKWPNDVYVQGKKIAGILIETQPVKSGQVSKEVVNGDCVAVVIGLGLNYRMLERGQMQGDEPLVLTDICEQVELQNIMSKPERNDIASTLLCKVMAVCQNYRRSSVESLEKFRASYDYCKLKKIEIILDSGKTLSGVAQGVNDNADLLVLVDGELCIFNSAEVSMRADKAMGV